MAKQIFYNKCAIVLWRMIDQGRSYSAYLNGYALLSKILVVNIESSFQLANSCNAPWQQSLDLTPTDKLKVDSPISILEEKVGHNAFINKENIFKGRIKRPRC